METRLFGNGNKSYGGSDVYERLRERGSKFLLERKAMKSVLASVASALVALENKPAVEETEEAKCGGVQAKKAVDVTDQELRLIGEMLASQAVRYLYGGGQE